MGLFDGLRGPQEIKLNARSAMLFACFTMVAADGDIDDDEIAIIRRIDGTDNNVDWETAITAWRRIDKNIECVNTVTPLLNEDQRRFTMANLIDIAMADGVLDGSEKELLEVFLEAFQLSEDFVQDLIKVIATKNDQTPFS